MTSSTIQRPLRLLLVAGARPNFMKVAPILRAARAAGHEAILVHTGQHYDAAMSDLFFTELGIPAPHYHLNVGSASHAVQTARIMEAIEPVLLAERADWLVVVGDVNSTIACALVASKLREATGTRIAHVEAGLRSGDWRMPEEVNRVLTDRLSDLLLTPSCEAHGNLDAEGIPADRVKFVGNVMIDTLFAVLPQARAADAAAAMGLARGEYVVATLHRPSNVDDRARLEPILESLAELAHTMPVVFSVHPRTRKQIDQFELAHHLRDICVCGPLGYVQMLSLTDGARLVVTDSGGLQEETTALGVPCLTVREQTERPITITQGTNRMVSWPPTSDSLRLEYAEALALTKTVELRSPDGWDGHAAERIIAHLVLHTNRFEQ